MNCATLFRHPTRSLLILALILVGAWNLGGAWLWRSLVPSGDVPLRVVFANDSGGPISLKSIKVGEKPYAMDFDLPARATNGSVFFDFAQPGYVELIEVEYGSGTTTPIQRTAFKSDARWTGECEYRVSFGKTVVASSCDSLVDADSVPWEPDLNGPGAPKTPR